MKKILVIGCSFTAGSYIPTYKNLDDYQYLTNVYKRPIDEINDIRGWWYYVDYFKDKNVTVVACPGQGYFGYLQIMLYMIKELKWSFDEVWVQETHEPRICFNDHIDLGNTMRLPEYINLNFEYYIIRGRGVLPILPVDDPRHTRYALHDNFNMKMTLASANFLQNEIKKGYKFSFQKNTKNNNPNYIRILPDSYPEGTLYDHLMFKNLLVEGSEITKNGHQTEEGNKYIGELINKALNEKDLSNRM